MERALRLHGGGCAARHAHRVGLRPRHAGDEGEQSCGSRCVGRVDGTARNRAPKTHARTHTHTIKRTFLSHSAVETVSGCSVIKQTCATLRMCFNPAHPVSWYMAYGMWGWSQWLRSCLMHFVCCAHLQDKLGRAAVTLTRVVMNGSHEEEYQLMDVAKGWIKLRLVWKQL